MSSQGLVPPNELASYIYQDKNNTTLAAAAQATANTALANAATAQTTANIGAAIPASYGLTKNNYSLTSPAAMQFWQELMNKVGYAGANVSTPVRIGVALYGDSTMVGVGISQTGGGMGGAAQLSWPRQLAKIMANAGIPAQVNSVFGQANLTGATASSYAVYNTEVSVGGGDNADWSLANTNPSCPGGYPFRYTNGGAGGFNNAGSTFSFTPPNAFDTFEVFYTQHGGTLNCNVDGGAALTVSSGLGSGGTLVTIPSSYASFANGKSVYSVAHGTHTINVVIQSGTTTDIAGIHAYDSTISYVDLIPMCSYGAKIATLNDTTYFGAPAYITHVIGGLLYVWINLTVNDIGGSTTAASYLSAMTALQTLFKTGNGTIGVGYMIGPFTSAMNSGGGVAGEAITAQILAEAPSLSWYDGVTNMPTPVIDYASRWAGQGISGLMGGDGIHPTISGATDIARAVGTALLG
jgi:lysophospholipase L1-like esterase